MDKCLQLQFPLEELRRDRSFPFHSLLDKMVNWELPNLVQASLLDIGRMMCVPVVALDYVIQYYGMLGVAH